MMLLGADFDRNTYHWEGPFGLPFETKCGELTGWLTGWTRKVGHNGTILAPEPRNNEPMLYLMDPCIEAFRRVRGDDDVFVVLSKVSGRRITTIDRNFLFTIRENPAAPLEVMMTRKSPYSIAAFRGGVNSFWMRGG